VALEGREMKKFGFKLSSQAMVNRSELSARVLCQVRTNSIATLWGLTSPAGRSRRKDEAGYRNLEKLLESALQQPKILR
jgi:hypothetical protein